MLGTHFNWKQTQMARVVKLQLKWLLVRKQKSMIRVCFAKYQQSRLKSIKFTY